MRSSAVSKLPFALMLLAAAVVAGATLVEDACGSDVAHRLIYGSLWFRFMWAAVALSGLYLIYMKRLWRRPTLFLLHLSFLVILGGALVTSLMGRKGVMHLRKGIPSSQCVTTGQGSGYAGHGIPGFRTPFLVRLDDFHIQYYPGTSAPQDYVSQVTINHQPFTVSMNRILSCHGYRFYQASYDDDLQGTVLSVNYDPWGIRITYAGYALLALSIIMLTWPFRRKGKSGAAMLALALFLMGGASASAMPTPSVSADKAAAMEERQVVWNDRITPFGAMAAEFMQKVYGSRSYNGLTATQTVASMIMEPEAWSHEPMIKLKRGEYRSLVSYINPADGTLKGLGRDAKEDEKVALMVMLMQGSLIKPLADDVEPLPDFRVKANLLYHKVGWTLVGLILMASVTLVMALLSLWKRLRGRVEVPDAEGGRRMDAGTCLSASCFAFLLFVWLLRWCCSEHIPLSNGYETMIFVAMCLTGTSLFRPRLQATALGCSTMLMAVAHMGGMNPQITPLMPVLHSPWLSAHVSIVMISYALLVLSIVERKLLRPAVFCLALGIFLGAVWANVSWGTYWSWDPKESWALVTLLVYCVPLHTESLPWFRSMRNYRLYSLLALACLLMTYFGVNFLLGGMHSYGG